MIGAAAVAFGWTNKNLVERRGRSAARATPAERSKKVATLVNRRISPIPKVVTGRREMLPYFASAAFIANIAFSRRSVFATYSCFTKSTCPDHPPARLFRPQDRVAGAVVDRRCENRDGAVSADHLKVGFQSAQVAECIAGRAEDLCGDAVQLQELIRREHVVLESGTDGLQLSAGGIVEAQRHANRHAVSARLHQTKIGSECCWPRGDNRRARCVFERSDCAQRPALERSRCGKRWRRRSKGR